MACGDRVVTFQGHHSYIVSIAKLCKENGLFTDVTILCDDGKLLAHKIVLAAVSPFLCHVLEVDTANGHSGHTTIVMPDIRKEIVQQLLDFLYTGIMKLSPSATWELQQLVLLLQIDPQNVGVDTINVGLDPGKIDRLSDTVCQTLGIKIKAVAKAELAKPHKMSPKLSPSPSTKSPPLTNGIKDRLESPKSSPNSSSHHPAPASGHNSTPSLKIVTNTSRLSKPHEGKPIKTKAEQKAIVNPLKILVSGGSIVRANDSNDSHKNLNHVKDHPNHFSSASHVASASRDNPNVVPPLKLATRKRPLSEKIDYSDMMMAGETEIIKKGRGKARAKSGGGSRGGGGAGRGRGGGGAGGRVMDDVVCAICDQFDPIIPSSHHMAGKRTDWIGCDCNRWFHKFCTKMKEGDEKSFSCRKVHKICLPHNSSS